MFDGFGTSLCDVILINHYCSIIITYINWICFLISVNRCLNIKYFISEWFDCVWLLGSILLLVSTEPCPCMVVIFYLINIISIILTNLFDNQQWLIVSSSFFLNLAVFTRLIWSSSMANLRNTSSVRIVSYTLYIWKLLPLEENTNPVPRKRIMRDEEDLLNGMTDWYCSLYLFHEWLLFLYKMINISLYPYPKCFFHISGKHTGTNTCDFPLWKSLNIDSNFNEIYSLWSKQQWSSII